MCKQLYFCSENDIDPVENWLDIPPRMITTISEARSYDETTIPPATKPYRNDYDSKPSSQHPNDVKAEKICSAVALLILSFQEANTMAERDLGSTFLLPHTHLYKPDRVSLDDDNQDDNERGNDAFSGQRRVRIRIPLTWTVSVLVRMFK